MFRPRIIPVLLLRNHALVKSVGFKKHNYIGDPINAVRIFNDHEADELVFLDIDATREGRLVSLDFVRDVGEEANMPFAVGGGIRTLDDIRGVLSAGAEKVVIGTAAASNPRFVRQAADTFGSSTISVCIDVKRRFMGGLQAWVKNGQVATGQSPVAFARLMQQMGAGEVIVQSMERDGTMSGYDVPLVRSVSEALSIPVVALGGAGTLSHLEDAYRAGLANGLAAGSMFVYHGRNRGVLINYPGRSELPF